MIPDEQPEIVWRLRCAVGHLNAVIAMTKNGQPCEQVLHQLNAVSAALQKIGQSLINCQVHKSQAVILNSSSSQLRVAELKRLLSLYTISVQHFSHNSEVTL
jgi:DNA-binding FrmR family transcriptional regulator